MKGRKEVNKIITVPISDHIFDTGQELSEHSAPFDAVVQVIEGEGHFIIRA